MGTKQCGRCKVDKPRDNFFKAKATKDYLTSYCKECCNTAAKETRKRRRERDPEYRKKEATKTKEWRQKNPQKVAEQRKRSKKKTPEKNKDGFIRCTYGITIEDFHRMHETQGGVCAICKQPETRRSRAGGICNLHIDHCHETGKVRGLLCSQCNWAIGKLNREELLRNAIDYLNSSLSGS